MKIRLLLTVILAAISLGVHAQQGSLSGKVISRGDRQPVEGARVTVDYGQKTVKTTDKNGVFTFENIPYGVWRVTVSFPDYVTYELDVNINSAARTLGNISLVKAMTPGNMFGDMLPELDNGTDEDQSMPVSLSASDDIYSRIANYEFSEMRLKNRGFDSGKEDVYLNGVLMNDASTGYGPWSLFSGLNDVTRNQESTVGLQVSDYGVGGVNGVTQINARASAIRKGFRASVVHASGQYATRIMATYSTGMMDNGWAFAASASTRQGGNFWAEGVYYNAWGYFLSVDKMFARRHTLSLSFMGAPTERGTQAAAVQEIYDMLGTNYYNPNWGYQDGKKRNSRVRDNHEPIVQLNYFFDINESHRLSATASYRFGRNGYSALDWYQGDDPRPDYYRNLPSYFLRNIDFQDKYQDKAEALTASYAAFDGWMTFDNVRHLDWGRMYRANDSISTFKNAGGIEGNNVTGKRSQYIIEERRQDQRDLQFSLQMNSNVNRYLDLNYGLNYRRNRTNYFKVVKDLLGGDFYVDIDKYAERDNGTEDQIQNDLAHPNRVVREGDRFGYDYYAHINSGRAWIAAHLNYGHFEGTLGGEVGLTRMWREGRYNKGLFPANNEGKPQSLGNSDKKDFFTYTAKFGLSYKINGSNTVYFNIGQIVRAPYFQDIFTSPRTRNTLMPDLKTEKTFSLDLNYQLRLPVVQLRLTGFYATVRDQHDVISFYDDVNGVFSNFAMREIDQKHYGMEFGAEVPLSKRFFASTALTIGKYTYDSNPFVTQTRDNSSTPVKDMENARVYWKDYKIPGTPQTAVNVGLDYRSPKYLFIGVDLNYYDRMYLSMNPMRRTDAARILPSSPYFDAAADRNMVRQEKFSDAFVLNANIGKSWYIHRKYQLGFNVQVNNILNNQNIKTGGYEQMRVAVDKDGDVKKKVIPFDSRYFYMFGTTYYLNVYFRF